MSSASSDGTANAREQAVELLGPLVIGTFLNVWLLGILLMQAKTFFRCSRQSSLALKVFVSVLVVLETVASATDCWMSYDYVILNFGDVKHINKVQMGYQTNYCIITLVAISAFSFFAWRIWKLTANVFLACGVALSAVAQFGLEIVVLSYDITTDLFSEVLRMKRFIIPWLTLAPITNIVVCIILLSIQISRRAGNPSRMGLIDKISLFGLEANTATAIVAILDMALFFAYPKSNLHMIFFFILSKTFANSIIAMINGRQNWVGPLDGPTWRSSNSEGLTHYGLSHSTRVTVGTSQTKTFVDYEDEYDVEKKLSTPAPRPQKLLAPQTNSGFSYSQPRNLAAHSSSSSSSSSSHPTQPPSLPSSSSSPPVPSSSSSPPHSQDTTLCPLGLATTSNPGRERVDRMDCRELARLQIPEEQLPTVLRDDCPLRRISRSVRPRTRSGAGPRPGQGNFDLDLEMGATDSPSRVVHEHWSPSADGNLPTSPRARIDPSVFGDGGAHINRAELGINW